MSEKTSGVIATAEGQAQGDDKVFALRSIIIEQAHSERERLVAAARSEADSWMTGEMASLDKETATIIADAKMRADEMQRRQLLSAQREATTEMLRLQNRLLSDASKRFRDGLTKLRDRADYSKILTALALAAARSLDGAYPLKIRLAALDASMGDAVAAAVREKVPGSEMRFDRDPAAILGGCLIESSDGRRQVRSDWQSITEDLADVLAERLLSQL